VSVGTMNFVQKSLAAKRPAVFILLSWSPPEPLPGSWLSRAKQ